MSFVGLASWTRAKWVLGDLNLKPTHGLCTYQELATVNVFFLSFFLWRGDLDMLYFKICRYVLQLYLPIIHLSRMEGSQLNPYLYQAEDWTTWIERSCHREDPLESKYWGISAVFRVFQKLTYHYLHEFGWALDSLNALGLTTGLTKHSPSAGGWKPLFGDVETDIWKFKHSGPWPR